MKKYIFLIIFFSQLVNSQIKNGRIEYELIIGDDSELDKSELMSGYYSEAKENSKYVSFNLDFDDTQSHFYLNEILQSEVNNTSMTIAFSGVTGKYYKKKNENFVIEQTGNKLTGEYIIKLDIDTKWNLTNETKTIQNYLCYKAETEKIVNNEAGTFKRIVTAWYCPQVPLSFGPMEYFGLPGLIFELKDRNIIIGARKITLNLENLQIPKPNDNKIISEKEYNKIILDFVENMKK